MKTMQRLVVALGILCPFGLCHLAVAGERDAGKGNKSDKIDGLLQVAAAYKADRDLSKTEEYLLKVLELDGNNVKAGAELAWVNNEKGQFDKATALALATVAVDNNYGPAWRELGFALLMRKDYVNAAKALKKAIEIDPADKDARGYLDKVQDASLVARRRAA